MLLDEKTRLWSRQERERADIQCLLPPENSPGSFCICPLLTLVAFLLYTLAWTGPCGWKFSPFPSPILKDPCFPVATVHLPLSFITFLVTHCPAPVKRCTPPAGAPRSLWALWLETRHDVFLHLEETDSFEKHSSFQGQTGRCRENIYQEKHLKDVHLYA